MKEKERGIIINNGIGLIGHVGVGKTTLSAALHDRINEMTKENFNTFLIHDEKRENAIEINGEFYEPIVNNKTSGNMANALFQRIELGLGRGSERKLPKGTNIIEEFRLIQNKESDLTLWERNEVVRIFNNSYKKIDK